MIVPESKFFSANGKRKVSAETETSGSRKKIKIKVGKEKKTSQKYKVRGGEVNEERM